MFEYRNFLIKILILIHLLLLCSCSSYDKFKREADDFEIPAIIINADLQKTWAAVVSTMKRFEIEQQNMESGVIKTKWIDNTVALNFTDSFGSTDKIKSARFRLLISVSSNGASKKRPQTKVTIYKRQLVENDLFQGWKEIENDYITEKTLLYRIQRVVAMDGIIERLQRQKESKQIEAFEDQTNQSSDQLVPDIDSIKAPTPVPTPTNANPSEIKSNKATDNTEEEFPDI